MSQTEAEVLAKLKERRAENWLALKRACLAQHVAEMKGRVGGAAMCICGHGCGGCGACSMLGEIRHLFRYLPTDELPEEWRERVEEIRGLMDR